MSEESLNEVTQAAFHLGQVSERKRLEEAISIAKKHWPHTDVFPVAEYEGRCDNNGHLHEENSKCINFVPDLSEPIEPPRHKMQDYRNPGDSSPYDGPYYVFDERCNRCQFERLLEAKCSD